VVRVGEGDGVRVGNVGLPDGLPVGVADGVGVGSGDGVVAVGLGLVADGPDDGASELGVGAGDGAGLRTSPPYVGGGKSLTGTSCSTWRM
jgi:hypothetical protein